MSVST